MFVVWTGGGLIWQDELRDGLCGLRAQSHLGDEKLDTGRRGGGGRGNGLLWRGEA